jgi:hypothetical protein
VQWTGRLPGAPGQDKMEKEELLERYEAYGDEGDLFDATGHPDDALACWRRAHDLGPDNLSPRYSTAFLLEREDHLAEAAAEWRFIIGWCEERGYAISADWPRRELQRLEARLAGS